MNRTILLLMLAALACPSCAGSLHEDDRDGSLFDAAHPDADGGTAALDAHDVDARPDAHQDVPGDANDATPEADPCDPLMPEESAASNRASLVACLGDKGYARLSEGVFPVDRSIVVPDGAELTALDRRTATVVAESIDKEFLVKLSASSRVEGLRLDLNGKGERFTRVAHLSGSGSQLVDNEIYDSQFPGSTELLGVFFRAESDPGGTARDNDIHGFFIGVIFSQYLTADTPNRLEANLLHDIGCDAISMPGHGEIVGNEIFHNGFDCRNAPAGRDYPIPGAGIYSLDNANGALIRGNTIYDNCGFNIDVDGGSAFTVVDNSVKDPGYRFGGRHGFCMAPASVLLLDVSGSRFESNDVQNSGRAHNRVSEWAGPRIFEEPGASAYSDLPHRGRQAVGFVLAERPSSSKTTTSNRARDNRLRAFCEPTDTCVGLGFFASRDTGYDSAGDWSAATTNVFTGNTVVGSQHGSKRCGGNWYAADSECTGSGDPPDCNSDDYQHNDGDWARNDNCNYY